MHGLLIKNQIWYLTKCVPVYLKLQELLDVKMGWLFSNPEHLQNFTYNVNEQIKVL